METKVCGCGVEHDEAAWKALPFVGMMVDEVAELEMRNCECGSTLCLETLLEVST